MLEIRAFRPRSEPTLGCIGHLQVWTVDDVHVINATRENGKALDKKIYATKASRAQHTQDALRAAEYFIKRGYTVA